MELESKPRKMRFVTGPVQVVEDWLHAHDGQYAAMAFAWSVIGNAQHVTAQCVLLTEIEKSIRMQQLAMAGGFSPGQRRM
jgi:hypothetical protein